MYICSVRGGMGEGGFMEGGIAGRGKGDAMLYFICCLLIEIL